MLTTRLLALLKYYIFWLLFFVISRFIFISYNSSLLVDVPLYETILTFVKGLKLDLSIGGYVVFFASLFFALTFYLPNKILRIGLNIYTIIFIVLFSVVTITDCELYRNWGFRMDNTILLYLKTPKDALASTKLWLTVVLFLSTGILAFLSYWFYNRFVGEMLKSNDKSKWWSVPIFILVCGVVFIPIRGGLGIAPINTGAVYFSNHTFANHAAINVHWNLGSSLVNADKTKAANIIDNAEANRIFSKLTNHEWEQQKVTDVENPNIIILILESFSSRIMEPLGGIKGVTPNLNSLIHEGVLYTNCFANGDRSDKGIVSILNGYPAQPRSSIIKSSTKTEKLPYLTHELNRLGYQTSFYYGGDINFANMRSYLVSSKFDNIISLNDFKAKYRNSKWGIHDHVVFSRLYEDCNDSEQPFFKTFFTLSSHEPFDVPLQGPFSDETEENKYLNSAYYTDSCIGNFVKQAKTKPWWNNTIIIMVPDHGGRWPGNVNYSAREKYEIPLLLIGGALNVKDTLIDSYINQSDIVNIVSRQLNTRLEGYSFSKNRIDSLQSYAFYAFNNGFGYFSPKGGFIYDITSGKETYTEPHTTNDLINEGKAYMQTLLNDYNSK